MQLRAYVGLLSLDVWALAGWRETKLCVYFFGTISYRIYLQRKYLNISFNEVCLLAKRSEGSTWLCAACREGRSVLWNGAAGIPQQLLISIVLVSPEKGWICLTKLCDAPAAAQALPSHPFCSAAAETFCMFAECKITQIDFCLVLIRISVLEVVVDFFPFPFPLLLLPVWILFVIHVIAVAMSSLQISLKEIHGRDKFLAPGAFKVGYMTVWTSMQVLLRQLMEMEVL